MIIPLDDWHGGIYWITVGGLKQATLEDLFSVVVEQGSVVGLIRFRTNIKQKIYVGLYPELR